MNLLNAPFASSHISLYMNWSISYISFDNLQAATNFALSSFPEKTIYLDDNKIDVGQWVARTFGMENKIPILIVNSRSYSEVRTSKRS